MLFRSASVGAEASFGLRLTARVGASMAVAFNSTHLTTAVTGDIEGVANTKVNELVTQVLVEGGATYRPARLEHWRLAPVITAGGGFLRQLNAGRTLVQNGQTGYVGVSMRYVERARKPGRWKASGIRADIRLNGFHGGVALDSGVHLAPSLAASVFTWF